VSDRRFSADVAWIKTGTPNYSTCVAGSGLGSSQWGLLLAGHRHHVFISWLVLAES
jgi:hypothetical protein